MKFLIVEDDKVLNKNICLILKDMGACDSAFDGEEGLFKAQQDIYDLIILDVMMPKKDGFEVLKELRKTSNCPVLMLTALGSVSNKVKGLDLGADDYLAKPFYRDEFIARVSALLRRYNNNFQTLHLTFKGLDFDINHKTLTIDGKNVELIGKNYDILEYLIRNKNVIIPKEQLFNRIWGYDCDTIGSVVEVYVSNLRKILKDYDYAKYLKTIRNVGYKWSEEDNE